MPDEDIINLEHTVQTYEAELDRQTKENRRVEGRPKARVRVQLRFSRNTNQIRGSLEVSLFRTRTCKYGAERSCRTFGQRKLRRGGTEEGQIFAVAF
jgi:hypothetical protein